MKIKFILLSIHLNRVLSVFGLKLIRNKKPKLYRPGKYACHHPRALNSKEFNQNFLFRVPVNLGRTSRWFDLSENSLDPILSTLNIALKRDLTADELYIFLRQTLKVQNKLISPLNAATLVGLDSGNKSILFDFPAWSSVLPWQAENIKDKFHTFPDSVKNDRLKSGFKIDSNDPIEIMRLNKAASFDSHVKQYINLLDSIGKHGILQGGKYGYISVFILIDNDNWRWIVGGEGNHRVDVASAIGYNELDVIVEGVIRKEDLKWWPNVCNGLYTSSQAEQVFNDIFNAKPSFTYSAWKSYFIDKIR
jgi:hypothetical protein